MRIPIGVWVVASREKKGWSQQELARLCGLKDVGTVSRWERGIIAPGLDVFRVLCGLFGERADKVLDRVDLIAPNKPASKKKANGEKKGGRRAAKSRRAVIDAGANA